MIAIMYYTPDPLFAEAPVRRWPDGATLFRSGDQPVQLFRVARGRVLLRRSLQDGTEVTLQDARSGHVVAEASAYAASYHCDAYAVGETETQVLPLGAFLRRLGSSPDLAAAWASHLARAVQAARFRVELRSMPTVRARLDAWLSDGNLLPLKGRLQDVAVEIGVSREALYRELARRGTNRPKTAIRTGPLTR